MRRWFQIRIFQGQADEQSRYSASTKISWLTFSVACNTNICCITWFCCVSFVEEQLLSGWRQSRSVKLKEHTVTWSTLDIYSEAELPLISENNSTSSPSAGECFPAKNRAPGMWDGKAVDGRGRGGDGGGGREEEGRSEWGGRGGGGHTLPLVMSQLFFWCGQISQRSDATAKTSSSWCFLEEGSLTYSSALFIFTKKSRRTWSPLVSRRIRTFYLSRSQDKQTRR